MAHTKMSQLLGALVDALDLFGHELNGFEYSTPAISEIMAETSEPQPATPKSVVDGIPMMDPNISNSSGIWTSMVMFILQVLTVVIINSILVTVGIAQNGFLITIAIACCLGLTSHLLQLPKTTNQDLAELILQLLRELTVLQKQHGVLFDHQQTMAKQIALLPSKQDFGQMLVELLKAIGNATALTTASVDGLKEELGQRVKELLEDAKAELHQQLTELMEASKAAILDAVKANIPPAQAPTTDPTNPLPPREECRHWNSRNAREGCTKPLDCEFYHKGRNLAGNDRAIVTNPTIRCQHFPACRRGFNCPFRHANDY